MILLDNTSFHYPEASPLLSWNRFEVGSGSLVSLLGPSGCGKSTIVSLMAGLLTPQSGRVLIDRMPPDEYRKQLNLSVVFQRPVLLSWRNAFENIRLPFELNNSSCSDDRIYSALDMVGLREVADKRPSELSGGMRSRIALAQSLVTNPKTLLLDEPFASLDEHNRIKLSLTVARLQRNMNITTVLVTHNISDAIMISDRIVVMGRKGGTEPVAILEDISIPFANRSVESLELAEFRHLYRHLVDLMSNTAEHKRG